MKFNYRKFVDNSPPHFRQVPPRNSSTYSTVYLIVKSFPTLLFVEFKAIFNYKKILGNAKKRPGKIHHSKNSQTFMTNKSPSNKPHIDVPKLWMKEQLIQVNFFLYLTLDLCVWDFSLWFDETVLFLFALFLVGISFRAFCWTLISFRTRKLKRFSLRRLDGGIFR